MRKYEPISFVLLAKADLSRRAVRLRLTKDVGGPKEARVDNSFVATCYRQRR